MFFYSLDICVNRLMRLVWGGVGGYDIMVYDIMVYERALFVPHSGDFVSFQC